MGVIAAAARELVAAGVTGDALVTALERIEEASRPARSAGAERMIRYRARKQDERNSDVTRDASPPDKEIPPTPPKEINPSSSLRSEEHTARVREAFEETFWPRYPHKVGKPAARKAFAAAMRRADLDRIISGLDRYIFEKPPSREWMNPATFLNQDRFDDQPASPPTPNGKPAPGETILRSIARVVEKRSGMGAGQANADDGPHGDGGPPQALAHVADDLAIPDFLRRQ